MIGTLYACWCCALFFSRFAQVAYSACPCIYAIVGGVLIQGHCCWCTADGCCRGAISKPASGLAGGLGAAARVSAHGEN